MRRWFDAKCGERDGILADYGGTVAPGAPTQRDQPEVTVTKRTVRSLLFGEQQANQ